MAKDKSYLDGLEATKALESIEKEYEAIMNELQKDGDEAIDYLQKGWKGDDCIDFINAKMIPALNDAGTEVSKIFQSINDTITQNAQNYERKYLKGGRNVFTKVAHTYKKVGLSLLSPFVGTVIGITSASHVILAATAMNKMREGIREALSRARRAAARSGFYGGRQQEAFNNSMKKINESLNKLTEEFHAAIKKKATQETDEASSIAESNASTFE